MVRDYGIQPNNFDTNLTKQKVSIKFGALKMISKPHFSVLELKIDVQKTNSAQTSLSFEMIGDSMSASSALS